MSKTFLVNCSCKHPYQDSVYGKGVRVANEKQNLQRSCTVCSAKHGASKVEEKKGKK